MIAGYLVIFTPGFLLMTSAIALPSTLALRVTPQRFERSRENAKWYEECVSGLCV